jgi:uncharacterized protein (TIGR02266 family)
MTYSGAEKATKARETLGDALGALQADSNIPEDVLSVASNIASAVGALFEAERASSEIDGKGCVKHALESLSQTLALLQDVKSQHQGIEVATQTIASAMTLLFPLTTVPTRYPPATSQPAPPVHVSAPPAREPSIKPAPMPLAPATSSNPIEIEANIGASTETNFFVGFSGEIAEGGVFIATYTILERSTPVNVLLTLPGGFEMQLAGMVNFVRDPMDFSSSSEPGIGVRFENVTDEQRQLMLRFIAKRAPIFYDE